MAQHQSEQPGHTRNPFSPQAHREELSDNMAFMMPDQRPEAVAQRKLQEIANNSPQVQQLKRVQAMTNKQQTPANVLQPKFVAEGDWMDDVKDAKLVELFGSTTSSLWKAMRDSSDLVIVRSASYGASFNFGDKVLSVSSDWLASIKKYVDKGEKDSILGKAISAFTHELSHAHDHFVKNETPSGKNRDTDEYVTAVLKTELKAWMKEARSARENSKEKSVSAGDDNNALINSWLGVHFSLKDGKDILTADTGVNQVIGRLTKYFNDNKSSTSPTTLRQLMANASNGLMTDIINYAQQIRDKYASADDVLRDLSSGFMAS